MIKSENCLTGCLKVSFQGNHGVVVAEYYVLLTGLFICVFQLIVALRCRKLGSKFLTPSASVP